MARNNDWQEKGIRIAGVLLSEQQTAEIAAEMRRRIKDPKMVEEIEQVLRGERIELSDRTRDALRLVALGIIMRQDKRR